MTMKSLAALLGLSALVAVPATAQVTVNASASITVPAVLYLGVTNTTVTFGSPSSTDYDAGFIGQSSAASVVSHRGNVRHDVRIWTDQATMNATSGTFATDPVNSSKPVSDLLWSTDNFGSVSHPLTQAATASAATSADQVLVSQSPRGAFNNAETISFRMNLSYANDTPGTYSVDFFYTVIAN